MKPWHLRDPKCFERERDEVEREYAELHFTVRGEQIWVSGSLPVRDEQSVIDRFAIEITLLDDYPNSLPVVREVGGRIPHVLGRHVIPNSGDACILLPDDRWRSWPRGSSLGAFISGPVRNYFIGQALVERGESWPFGEWNHGFQGMRDYYREVFSTDDPPKVRKYLEYIAAKKIRGHWDCPCGSGERLRDCHMDSILALRSKMPRPDAAQSVARLDRALQLQNLLSRPSDASSGLPAVQRVADSRPKSDSSLPSIAVRPVK